jgi:hypothetical protein
LCLNFCGDNEHKSPTLNGYLYSRTRQNKKQLKKLKTILLITIAVLIGIPLLILTILLMIVFAPFGIFKIQRFEKKYAEFLIENNGKNFFCYNNRKNSKQYIAEDLLPSLRKGIEIVYLNGKSIESEYNSEFMSKALYSLKNYNKFPHLIKIRNGQLIDMSINNPFYGVLNMDNSKTELLEEINLFFEPNE